jgi:hypothetical protein
MRHQELSETAEMGAAGKLGPNLVYFKFALLGLLEQTDQICYLLAGGLSYDH